MKTYALLLFLVSLAVAEISRASSSNSPGDVGNTEFAPELFKRDGLNKFCTDQSGCDNGHFCFMFWCIADDPALFPDVLCRSNNHCKDKGAGYVCTNGICAPPKSTNVAQPSCNTDDDCQGNAKCEGNFCINHDVTIMAPDISDPSCKKDSDCGGLSCVNGICLLNSRTKMRFARHSPQVLCHNDQECMGTDGTPAYCKNGICMAYTGKLARSPQ